MGRVPSHGYAVKYGVGLVTAGEGAAALAPLNWAGDGTVPGVMFLHGAGGSAQSGFERGFYFGGAAVACRLAQAGFPVLTCDLGGTQTWGYTPVNSRIADAISYLQSTMGAKTGKIALIGESMGGLNSLNYAAAFPSNVSCFVGIFPVSDVDDIHTRNPGGAIAGLIDGVYPGGWSQATYGATYNPITRANAGSFANLPMQLWQGLADTTVTPANTAALAAACAKSTVTYLQGGHAELTASEIDPGQVIKFIAANA